MEVHDISKFSVADFFENKFSFKKENDWKLYDDIIIEDITWNINSFLVLKQDLNAIKSLLNDKGEDWHEHTAKINKAAYVIHSIKSRIQPEILTQAWCKFYEILSSYNLFNADKKNIHSLHLCEAPGAFISALNYYLCVNHPSIHWQWVANTLNPYYEGHNIRNVIADDRLLFPTLKNWYFGNDNTGDITNPNYIDDLSNLVRDVGLFDLVTADGSIDCLNNPGEQELVVSKLQFAEVLVALNSLLPGGCFILKKFTLFECITICELYLLNCVFEKVHVFKPFTSRPSNSEVYVVCIGFQGSELLSRILEKHKDLYRTKNTLPIFSQSVVPETFLRQLEACSTYFNNLQINAIKENIKLYPLQDELVIKKLENMKEACAEAFICKYSVISSTVYDACKLYSAKKKVVTSFYDSTTKNCKTIYFQAVGDTFNNIKKSSFLLWQEKLLDVEKRINVLFPKDNKRHLEEIEWQYPLKEVKKKMKSKYFQNWIISGEKIKCIQNSKFCYSVLLYLWNQVSNNSQIDVQSHSTSQCYWDIENLVCALKEEPSFKSIVAISTSINFHENDTLLLQLKKVFNNRVIYSDMDNRAEIDLIVGNKTVYVNSVMWLNSLHQEILIKKSLTDALITVLKILKKGDNLLLCIQSLLTRYTAGLAFIVLSLFDKFTVILPEDLAPACVGQIWVFKNFQEHKWLDNATQHLAALKQINLPESHEVLEIVPITSLCGGGFQVYLRDINSKHLIQRLRSFISIEKCKIENL